MNKFTILINILLIGFIWVLIIIFDNSVFLTQVVSFESKQEKKNLK